MTNTGRGGLAAASALYREGRLADAAALCKRLLRAAPRDAGALAMLGTIALRRGEHDAAAELLGAAATFDPGLAVAHNNRGAALRALGRFDAAVASYDRAIALRPDFADAHSNRGAALKAAGRFEESAASLMRALRLHPRHMLARALLGEVREALEHRVAAATAAADEPAAWDGRMAPAGRTILLAAAGNDAETIRYCRYGPALAALGARVVIEADPGLAALLRRSALAREVIARDGKEGGTRPAKALAFPIAKLAQPFGEADEAAPWMPYLVADRNRVAWWRGRLAGLAGKRIGIAWEVPPAGAARLAALGMPGVRLIALGWRPAAADGIVDIGGEIGGIDDLAALIATLDLVVGADGMALRLAAALGVTARLLEV